jgi:hypothetical protein
MLDAARSRTRNDGAFRHQQKSNAYPLLRNFATWTVYQDPRAVLVTA